MENSVGNYLIRICNILNSHGVQYLLVGGVAVGLYGYYRLSQGASGLLVEKPDIDIWYNPTYDNYFKLLNALEGLGQDVSEFKKEQTPNPNRSYFKFDMEEMTLDLLPAIKASIKFRDAYSKREIISLQNVDLIFISYSDLLADKQTNPRTKDIEDIKRLEEIRKGKLR